MNTQLQEAKCVGGTSVSLRYADGFIQVLDLAPALRGPIFEPLKNADYFARLKVESDTIRWPNGADIDPSVLRLWAEKGRVLSQSETNACFVAKYEFVSLQE